MQATCTSEPYIVGRSKGRRHSNHVLLGHNGDVLGRRKEANEESTKGSPIDRPLGPSHIVIAGGEVAEWAAMSESDWRRRIDVIASAASGHGARHVTVFPYGATPTAGSMEPIRVEVSGVRVLVDPRSNGRERIAETLRAAGDGSSFDEKSVESLLHGEAGEPDLVVVLGASNRLPPSLVWELAYSELVFIPVHWSDLDATILSEAFDVFFGRERRFGGVDE